MSDGKDHGSAVMLNCGLSGLERWRLLSFGNEQYQIRSISTGLCLDVGASTTPRDVTRLRRMLAGEPRGLDGMRVRAYPHRTQPTPNREKWIPEWVDNVRVRIRDAATGLCIQMDPNLLSDGFLGIDLRACNGSRAQTWRVQPVSENAFRLRNDQPSAPCGSA